MKETLRSACRRVLMASTIVFAVIGVAATVWLAYWYLRLPRNFGSANSFLIVDVYKSRTYEGDKTRIYLDGASAGDLQFDGPELTHRGAKKTHVDATILLNGLDVAGAGTILFGSTVISINDGAIAVSGHDVCPAEITATRHGRMRAGAIRMAR